MFFGSRNIDVEILNVNGNSEHFMDSRILPFFAD